MGMETDQMDNSSSSSIFRRIGRSISSCECFTSSICVSLMPSATAKVAAGDGAT